ncbi:unnamed protein product [Didymodactylos carnosus]|uniref:LamG-like jellyroll fold domain-containing protein n=1 Tax=Didymodactylos carnosus TaxID=1234261 RepID=A0A815EMR8_9BILA|nr:unnamed protein product [Didymodactylos carnosus]CAF4155134.1 unnamed protein product [Didymodactylos carnosus]
MNGGPLVAPWTAIYKKPSVVRIRPLNSISTLTTILPAASISTQSTQLASVSNGNKPSSNDDEDNNKQYRHSPANNAYVLPASLSISSNSSSCSTEKETSKQKKKFKDHNKSKNKVCFSKLWTMVKKIPLKYKILIGITLGLLICVIAVVPAVVITLSQKKVSTTTTYCVSTTCINNLTAFHAPHTLAFYSMDGNVNDLNNVYDGQLLSATGSIGYNGGDAYSGQSLGQLTSTQGQYVLLPYIPLSYQSFTIEMWVKLIYSTGQTDYGLFGQCSSTTLPFQCLVLSIRNYHLHMSFGTGDTDLYGETYLYNYIWVHVAFVYDSVLLQKSIYINGIIDATSSVSTSQPFQGGASGMSTIALTSNNSYFNGDLDQVTISNVAKSSCEILNDATLVVYYPFDTTNTFEDYGPTFINGNGANLVSNLNGRLNQAITFSSSQAYFQSQSFTCIHQIAAFGPPSFSVSLFINPTQNSTTSGSTLVHLSVSPTGSISTNWCDYCYDLLALTSTNLLVAQIFTCSPSAVSSLTSSGTAIVANQWTHIALTYAYQNGVRLYVNGLLVAFTTSGSVWFSQYNVPAYVTLGNTSPLGVAVTGCTDNSTFHTPGPFQGSIDEFRIYGRELNVNEICVLANPSTTSSASNHLTPTMVSLLMTVVFLFLHFLKHFEQKIYR